MLYNLLKWDAYANYQAIAIGVPYEICMEMIKLQPEDKRWHKYEIVKYIPF